MFQRPVPNPKTQKSRQDGDSRVEVSWDDNAQGVDPHWFSVERPLWRRPVFWRERAEICGQKLLKMITTGPPESCVELDLRSSFLIFYMCGIMFHHRFVVFLNMCCFVFLDHNFMMNEVPVHFWTNHHLGFHNTLIGHSNYGSICFAVSKETLTAKTSDKMKPNLII